MSVTSGTKRRGLKKEHHMQRLSEQGLKKWWAGEGPGVRGPTASQNTATSAVPASASCGILLVS